ncbi:MAG: hypothetical protein U1E89_03445 [Burkholderiaceae bacterium]
MSLDYYHREADLEVDRDRIVATWALGLEGLVDQVADAKFRHSYVDNPAGAGMCLLLHQQSVDTAIGAQGLISRIFFAGQDQFRVATLADFVVAPEHRSLGPALILMRACIELSREHFEFAYGTPNDKSVAILNRAGIRPFGNLTRYTKLIRSQSYLSARVLRWVASPVAAVADAAIACADIVRNAMFASHYRWSEKTEFGEEFAKVWEGRQSDMVTSERSPRTLRWRYSTAEHSVPWHFSLATDRSGTPIGYVIWRQVKGIAMVSDFFCSEMEKSIHALLQSFVVYVRKFPVQKVSLEFFGRPSIGVALRACGFAPREQSSIVLVDHGKGQGDRLLASASRMFMTGFDRDHEI